MVSDLRAKFESPNLPFVLVQSFPLFGNLSQFQPFPGLAPEPYNCMLGLSTLRLSQADALSLPGVGMACTIDLGDPGCPFTWQHNRAKRPCAHRAALAARSLAYSEQGLVYRGPEPKSVRLLDNSGRYKELLMVFDMHGSTGFHRSSVPISVLSFEILFADNATSSSFWIPATLLPARGNAVEINPLDSLGIGATAFFGEDPMPRAVRYGHGDFPTGIVHNVEGLPVGPFVVNVPLSTGSRIRLKTDDSRLTFSSVTEVGSNYRQCDCGKGRECDCREDPGLISLGNGAVIVGANSSAFGSTDGGQSFRKLSPPAVAISSDKGSWGATGSYVLLPGPGAARSVNMGLEGAFKLPRVNVSTGWTSTWSYDGAAFHMNTTSNSQGNTYRGLPAGVLSLSVGSGGNTQLKDGSFVAVAAARFVPGGQTAAEYKRLASEPCCNISVVAFRSDDGIVWNFASVVATKSSIPGPSQEGADECDVVLLPDGKTLWTVMRTDGGDGDTNCTNATGGSYPQLCNRHAPYVFATSSNQGNSWSDLRYLPSNMQSAKPRALVTSTGALLVSGGRPGLHLWESPDGRGEHWIQHDIPTIHNSLVAEQLKFCAQFENQSAAAFVRQWALGWSESSGYTTLREVSNGVGLLCYERQGWGAGYNGHNPAGCEPSFSTIFCMGLKFTRGT